jgi:hypothetical protein
MNKSLSNEDHCGPCGQYNHNVKNKEITKEISKKEELEKTFYNKI